MGQYRQWLRFDVPLRSARPPMQHKLRYRSHAVSGHDDDPMRARLFGRMLLVLFTRQYVDASEFRLPGFTLFGSAKSRRLHL